jgi:hypothetical protein
LDDDAVVETLVSRWRVVGTARAAAEGLPKEGGAEASKGCDAVAETLAGVFLVTLLAADDPRTGVLLVDPVRRERKLRKVEATESNAALPWPPPLPRRRRASVRLSSTCCKSEVIEGSIVLAAVTL